MGAFIFDEERHEYTLDGVVLPSVSQIIKPLSGYGSIPENVLAAAAARGKAIHRASELIDRGTLVESSLDERIVPYVKAYRQFALDHMYEWDFVELPMYSDVSLFAGTPDRIGVVGDTSVLVDLKSTLKLEAAVAAQMAGYARLMESNNLDFEEIRILHLRKDATYTFDVIEPDFDAFDACLRKWQAEQEIRRWRSERNL